jgi:hypothetical protein
MVSANSWHRLNLPQETQKGAKSRRKDAVKGKLADADNLIVRKRILVAALATAGIAVTAYVLSQPKEGSLEWHKRRYSDYLHALSGEAVPSKVEGLWHVAAGQRIELRNYGI